GCARRRAPAVGRDGGHCRPPAAGPRRFRGLRAATGDRVMTASFGGAFAAVFTRDLRVALRRWSDLGNASLFFILVVTLFPLALSPKADFLRLIAPGVLWIAALLATLLSLNLLFRSDI